MSARRSEKGKKLLKNASTPNQEKERTDLQNDSLPIVALERPEDIRTVVISIDFFKNIIPIYPISDIKAVFKYLDKNIGETDSIPITDDEKLTLGESVQISIDINSVRQVDQLASFPIFITIIQLTGTRDAALYEQITKSIHIPQSKPTEDVESLFSLYEAFTGEPSGVKIADMKKHKKKVKKETSEKALEGSKSKLRSMSSTSRDSKTSRKSKKSRSSVGEIKSRASTVVPIIKSEIYGMCVIDLIPLFYGQTYFTEKLLLHPVKKSCHILSTYKNFPEVTVTVSIKEDIPLLNNIKNILNFTVESICNVPTLMTTDMDCKICVLLPLLNLAYNPTIFYNPKITTKAPLIEVPKRWPGIHDIGYNANTTKYLIDSTFDGIKNKANLNLMDGFRDEATRLEFDYLKRNILFRTGNNDFATHLINHRKLVLEIYLTPKTRKQEKLYDVYSDEPDNSPKPRSSKTPPFLHLMAVLDVSSLLYPGMKRIRIAAPLSTFTYEEAAKMGLEDSYFLPQPVDTSRTSKTKLGISQKKKMEKKEKATKKDKTSTVKEDKNLATLLPPRPEEIPPPEPSVPVYNEEGKHCFIIVEIELLKPVNAKRNNEELQADLHQIKMDAVTSRKTILNKHVASDFYKQTINEIVDDLNQQYLKYYEIKTTLPSKASKDFLGYLQKTGAYQTYLNSITAAATYVVTHKYKCEEKDFKNSRAYQNLISEVFTDLISEMHNILNTLVSNGMKPILNKLTSYDEHLFYAHEAAELRLYSLADRYFMERIIYDKDNNSNYWFDYAVFNIEIGDTDKAFECLKEAIAKNCDNKYSLLLFGALLTEKGKTQEAETCFLSIMVQAPKWLEGWSILFLFYQKCGREDGMDMAYDMGKNLIDDPRVCDYVTDYEDLAWNFKNIPDTMFFKAAILLIKTRLYSWAELALAQEVTTPKNYGFVNYLLAVICYYRKDYVHALEHIEEAKEFQGGDFAILGLSGHCLFAQDRLKEARNEYFHVIESYDRPDDIHLIYLNCAAILERLGDHQMARKLILTACKYHQTPYLWFTAGKLYFIENDILSAEESLTEANSKDNKYANVWAYLTLVNLKLARLHEAEQCYEQAIKSKLDDEDINNKIKEEFKRVSS